MKILSCYLFFALFSQCLLAKGLTDEQRAHCIDVSYVYGLAATFRDGSFSPQATYKRLTDYQANVQDNRRVSNSDLKKIINTVYFDSQFLYKDSGTIENTVQYNCLGFVKHYRPLK